MLLLLVSIVSIFSDWQEKDIDDNKIRRYLFIL
jgi:hypothetical protein